MKNRNISLDVVKGWLIVCLVFHHISDIGLYKCAFDSDVLRFIEIVGSPLYACYFMQTFFLITGMCSNFDKTAKVFIVRQFRGLIVPVICFTLVYQLYYCGLSDISRIFRQIVVYGGDFWFLYAMFFCKVIYYYLNKYLSRRWLFGTLALMSLLGSLLNEFDLLPNYFWHRQILDFTLFVGIGHHLKQYLQVWTLRKWATPYFIVVVTSYLVCGTHLPIVTAGFNSSLAFWPIHILLSITGSCCVIAVAKTIGKAGLTSYIGTRSMMVYIIQVYANGYFLHLFASKLISDFYAESVIATFVIVCSIVALSLFVEYVLDRTPLKFVLGKPVNLKPLFTPPVCELKLSAIRY